MFFGYIDPGSGMVIAGGIGWLMGLILSFLVPFLVFFKKIFEFFKRHKKISIPLFLILALSCAILIGAHMNRNKSRFDKRIVILGFDGLSPKIMEPMMRDGKLPNFTRLKEDGSYRHLSTTNPSQSPVAWTGFATGQNPGKHGVFDFIVRDPETYMLDLSLSNIEKGKPRRVVRSRCFWHYTSQRKVPTVIIGCPVTFPPDKIYGRMLSGMGVPDILGTEGTFTFYTTEALQRDKDIGGKVFKVNKGSVINLNFIGPRKAVRRGSARNVKVPFKVLLQPEKERVIIEYHKNRFELKEGQWSDWKEVTFNLGPFRRMKGIFKFYLVEIAPEFKLYLSPINFDPRHPFFQISYPKNYSRELANHIGLYYTQGEPMDTWAVNEKRLSEKPFLEQVNEVLREKRAMFDFEIERLKNGVLYCYFESPDIIQHMFWRYTDPQHPLYEEDAPREYRDMIKTWYQHMDNILGSIIGKLNEEDVILILSDHGFDTFRRAVHVNTWLRENGYLALKRPAAKSGRELLEDIDWSKTKAYAIGFGAIYLNQEGRERDGIVKPGRETELLKDEIVGKLLKWMDEKYNRPIISNVYSREDIFWGPYAEQTPDLYIGFNIGYRASWQTALGAVPPELVEDNLKKWSGSHLFDPALIPGVLFSNRVITRENPSLYDIAPTVLKTIGFAEEELGQLGFDGKPIF